MYGQTLQQTLEILNIDKFACIFICMLSSLKIDHIYLSQYLELWKVIICKTTGLTSIFQRKKYISWDLNKKGTESQET